MTTYYHSGIEYTFADSPPRTPTIEEFTAQVVRHERYVEDVDWTLMTAADRAFAEEAGRLLRERLRVLQLCYDNLYGPAFDYDPD